MATMFWHKLDHMTSTISYTGISPVSQTEYARFDNGRFVYRINRSPMCDYMVSFIHRLKHLPERYMMNSVLENFTILQVYDEEASGRRWWNWEDSGRGWERICV